ncbi:hypothetical protein [Qipengyuania qiaonensis]|uniref:Uncharacterized protein n=1 Tax=Qipengyuania qiaonensis TaxID=2867240 RepID=A0ABS7J548_9SPHN|nr:hypothetical protein [Qipengyuania qiaonensis]MBX7482402.1 hypothetical protein [Qipengyuania qiaonensis]
MNEFNMTNPDKPCNLVCDGINMVVWQTCHIQPDGEPAFVASTLKVLGDEASLRHQPQHAHRQLRAFVAADNQDICR